MMKKSMLLAMGLSVAALNWGGVTYLHAASVASLAASAVADDETETTNLPKTFGNTGDENTATISKSDDGKTLTIKGKGDLTKIGTAYKFVSSLPTELFKQDGDNHTNVNGGEDYSSQTTYQTRSPEYNEITDFKTTYTEQKTHYYFTETGAGKYYTRTQSGWNNETSTATYTYSPVKKDDEINKTEWVDGATKTAYFTKSGDEYTRVEALTTITNSTEDAESRQSTELKGCNGDVFYLSNGKYVQAYNGTVYDENTTYYQRSWTYTTITFDDLYANAYLRNESEFIKALWANNTYETVKFEKDGDGELLIDNDIVKALLYYQVSTEWNTYFNVNTNITTLDLRAATCKNFSSATFENTLQAGNGTLKLATVTLPQSTNKTVPALVVESIRESNGQAIVTTITVPDGYTAVGDSAFINVSKATAINLPAGIDTIGKRAFYSTGITSWVLPDSLKTIGDDAFGSSKVAHVTFPASLRTIGKGAFAICNDLDSINLNEGLEVIGNSAFYLASKNDKVKVLEIPSTVKYIGPAAFNFRWYSDVYYYGKKAPISPYGKAYSAQDVSSAAFGSQLLCGNNGFQPMASKNNSTAGNISTGYANRENYINGGTYIAVLHFRSEISDDNAETFTDITRKYERWLYTDPNNTSKDPYWYAQDKKTVGQETEAPSFNTYGPGMAQQVTPGFEDTDLGSQFIWPSQSQFMRSYAVNSNGYKWDGVTEYRPSLTEDELKFIKAQEEGVAGTDLANATDDYLKKVAYLGTRQFVLISRDVKGKKDEYPAPVTEGERWWTLCVPCDVTKGEVDRVFGSGTHLCLFSKVDRKITTDGASVSWPTVFLS